MLGTLPFHCLLHLLGPALRLLQLSLSLRLADLPLVLVHFRAGFKSPAARKEIFSLSIDQSNFLEHKSFSSSAELYATRVKHRDKFGNPALAAGPEK